MQSFFFSAVALLCALKVNAQVATITSISPSQESALISDVEIYLSTLVDDPVVSKLATAIPTSLYPLLESLAEQFAPDPTAALSLAANPTALAAEASSLLNVANSALATESFYTDLLAFETRVVGEVQSIAAQDLGAAATATATTTVTATASTGRVSTPTASIATASTGFVSAPSSMITASPNATTLRSPPLTTSTTISAFTAAAMPMVKGGVQAVFGAAAAAAAAGIMAMVVV